MQAMVIYFIMLDEGDAIQGYSLFHIKSYKAKVSAKDAATWL